MAHQPAETDNKLLQINHHSAGIDNNPTDMEYYPAEINHHCAGIDDNRTEMNDLNYLSISVAQSLISSGLLSISETVY